MTPYRKIVALVLFSALGALSLPGGLMVAGCQQAPSQRVQAVTTLKILGASVDTSMKLAAQLYHDGKLTKAQWDKIAAFHDGTFQPAFRVAIAAVQANVDSVASPDLIALAGQLAALIPAK